jgi:hypothetical protein
MSKKEYRKLLTDPRWKVKRLIILARDKNQCTECGGIENLQVHHKIYDADCPPWESQDEDLITICKDCHKDWHKKNHNLIRKQFFSYKNISSYIQDGKQCKITSQNTIISSKKVINDIIEGSKKEEENLICTSILSLSNDALDLFSNYKKGNVKVTSVITGEFNATINLYIRFKK